MFQISHADLNPIVRQSYTQPIFDAKSGRRKSSLRLRTPPPSHIIILARDALSSKQTHMQTYIYKKANTTTTTTTQEHHSSERQEPHPNRSQVLATVLRPPRYISQHFHIVAFNRRDRSVNCVSKQYRLKIQLKSIPGGGNVEAEVIMLVKQLTLTDIHT